MASLSSSGVLALWERGRRLHPLDQGLAALAASAAGDSWDELVALPLGERNRKLLELHAASFGTAIHGAVDCPMCGEKLEFTLDAGALTSGTPAPRASVSMGQRRFRLPSSRDVALAARAQDADGGARRLLELCEVDGDGNPALSDAEVEEAGELLAQADPLAETRLALACSACGHAWDDTLEPAIFLWTEIEAQARRLLHEVHVLASAYHWSEAEILAMGEGRRALYLEMLRA